MTRPWLTSIVSVMRTAIPVPFLLVSAWADGFGTWTMNSARSTLAREPRPKSISIRIESHTKGEVFTLDRVESDGRATTSSSLLYLDGKPRDFQDTGCSGTQASRRIDSQTVEILRTCADGGWIRFVRRFFAHPNELVLDITEQQAGGGRVERHLLLEKQK
jgi:predicted acyl esterase